MQADSRLSGVCDCHVHIVGSLAEFPQSATRSYMAKIAALSSLRAAGEPHGVSRFVIVQASFYGTDNQCLLGALDTLGDCGRGVVMVGEDNVAPATLENYDRKGVRGLRVNLYSKSLANERRPIGQVLSSAFLMVPRARWHVELIASGSTLLSAAKEIADSKVPVVLDHYGLPEGFSPDSRQGGALLELVGLRHVWVKLTAPYRVGDQSLSTTPPANWLQSFLRIAPERCVWGSDWPHTPLNRDQKGLDVESSYRPIRYERLFRDFVEAVANEGMTKQILVSNPGRLYDFPSTTRTESR